VIIKTLSRKSNTGQLVSYIFKYVFKEKEKNNAPVKPENVKAGKGKFIIKHNIRSRSVKGYMKEFKENESYRLVYRKDSVMLFHTIISFSNKDKEHIDDKFLKDIAEKFIEERGLNNLYAGTKHEDKDHVHLHIAISGTQLNGRSSRISKQKLHSIKLALDKYQREKYPQLKHSLPEHGKSKRLAKEAIVERIKTERQTDKQALLACIEKNYSSSKSLEQFLSQLKEAGHQPYFRNGALQGIRYEGQTKYRLSRLGYDKTKLQASSQVKIEQDKTLAELQNLRSGRNREIKRTIEERDVKKSAVVVLDKEEQKIMDEISEIRSGREDKEISKDDDNDNRNMTSENEELNDKHDEDKETDDDEKTNDTDDTNDYDNPADEME
jgi:hypothetical protein